MGQQPRPMLDPELAGRFTAHEFSSLRTWCENNDIYLSFDRWLDGGRTSAKIAVVIVEDGIFRQRKSVLKFCPAGSGIPTDLRGFRRAADSSGKKFTKEHLTSIDRSFQDVNVSGPSGTFLLMEWQGGGLNNYVPLSSLVNREVLGNACGAITASVLGAWQEVSNARRGPRYEETAGRFLNAIVGRRCEPGGPIYEAVRELGLAGSATIPFGSGRQLSNPFASATGSDELNNVRIVGIRGNAHGDLHPGNILVPDPPSTHEPRSFFEKYILIDLSSFDSDRLLAIDPVHLIISIVNDWLPEKSPLRGRMRDFLLDPVAADSSGLPAQIAAAAREVHRAGTEFSERRHLYDEWQTERMLAIAGCALLFVGRNSDTYTRQWFLRLGGMAIEKIKETAARHKGRTLLPGAADGVSPPAQAEHEPRGTIADPVLRVAPEPEPPSSGTPGLPAASRTPEPPAASGTPGPPPSPGTPEPTASSGTPGPSASSGTPEPTAASGTPEPTAASGTAGPADQETRLEDDGKLPEGANVFHIYPPGQQDSAGVDPDQLLNEHVTSCLSFASELAEEVSSIDPDLSADRAMASTSVAREVLGDLTVSVTAVRRWHTENPFDKRIARATAINLIESRLRDTQGLLRTISVKGSNPAIKRRLEIAVSDLNSAVRQFLTLGRPDRPPIQ